MLLAWRLKAETLRSFAAEYRSNSIGDLPCYGRRDTEDQAKGKKIQKRKHFSHTESREE
jgi:hypothetical protein